MVEDLKFARFVLKKKNINEIFIDLNRFISFYIKYKGFIRFFFKISIILQVNLFSVSFIDKIFEGINFCDLGFDNFSSDYINRKMSASIYNWLTSYNVGVDNIISCSIKCITHKNVIPFLEDFFLIFYLKDSFEYSLIKINELFFDDLLFELQKYSDVQFLHIKNKNYFFFKNNIILYEKKLKESLFCINLKLKSNQLKIKLINEKQAEILLLVTNLMSIISIKKI